MNNHKIVNPLGTESPYYVCDQNGHVESAVHNIETVLQRFEPVDVLNGSARILDAKGMQILLVTDDAAVTEDNEYPVDYFGISLQLIPATKNTVSIVEQCKDRTDFLD